MPPLVEGTHRHIKIFFPRVGPYLSPGSSNDSKVLLGRLDPNLNRPMWVSIPMKHSHKVMKATICIWVEMLQLQLIIMKKAAKK
jgi:hypothetical protein